MREHCQCCKVAEMQVFEVLVQDADNEYTMVDSTRLDPVGSGDAAC